VLRRAGRLLAQNVGLTVDQLSGALVAERAVISTYVSEKSSLLAGGADPKLPTHLDLTAMRVRDGNVWYANAIAETLARRYPADRNDWIAQIVWLPMALHDDVLCNSRCRRGNSKPRRWTRSSIVGCALSSGWRATSTRAHS
jgi:hypothetical protein